MQWWRSYEDDDDDPLPLDGEEHGAEELYQRWSSLE